MSFLQRHLNQHRDAAGLLMLISICSVVFVFAFNGIAGCSVFRNAKSAIKTIDDIASDLCMFAASEQPQEALGGFSPGDFCKVKDNLQPFIDEALAAKMAASQASGFARDVPSDAGTE